MNWLEKKILTAIIKSQLEKISTMKLSWSTFFQVLASAGQYGDWALNVVPPKAKPFVSLGLGLIQVVIHWHAGQVNPDGTPAAVAYEKK